MFLNPLLWPCNHRFSLQSLAEKGVLSISCNLEINPTNFLQQIIFIAIGKYWSGGIKSPYNQAAWRIPPQVLSFNHAG
jgi:hypothetical protein